MYNRENLGALIATAPPNKRQYIGEIVLGILCMLIVFVIPQLILLLPILGIAVIISAIVSLSKLKRYPLVLEIYEGGVALGDFVVPFSMLDIRVKRGFSGFKFILYCGNQWVLFPFSIHTQYLQQVRAGIKNGSLAPR